MWIGCENSFEDALMAHSPDKKMKLRAAYIGGLPLEAASDEVGVPLATARNWYRAARAAGDDWDAFQRASLVVAGGGIEQALGRIIAAGLLRCEKLLEATENSTTDESVKAVAVLGDTVSKLRAASKGMMQEANALAAANAATVATEVAAVVKKGGLSDEAAERIRRRILGIGS